MEKISLRKKAAELDQNRKKRSRRQKVRSGLAALVAVATLYGLLLPAFTMERPVYCGMEEHTHSDDCYALTCGLEEGEGHYHADGCYEEQRVLACGKEEQEGHVHTSACYEKQRELSCGREESEGHTHSAKCYETVRELVCGKDEAEGHTHAQSCYNEAGELICGKEEREGHKHTDTCYRETEKLVCGKEESEGHHHTDACYTETEKLICGKEEREAHVHTDACYKTEKVLVCELGEGGKHHHTEDCYALVCGKEEHTHTAECHINTRADVENEKTWMLTLPVFKEETAIQRFAAIAVSQLGYRESLDNYQLDGELQRGYTRYGQWYGEPYADWDAMFVQFCLYYAGIRPAALEKDSDAARFLEAFTEKADVQKMMEALVKYECFITEEALIDFIPESGDIIFFKDPATGIVTTGIVYGTDPEKGTVEVIRGNTDDAVRQTKHALDDETILGYGRLPEEILTLDVPEEQTSTELPVVDPLESVQDDQTTEPFVAAMVFEDKTDSVSVLVEAPDGAFPEGTTMELTPVKAEDVMDAVTDVVDQAIVHVEAVDITFYYNGEKIEPALPIRVHMQAIEAVKDAADEPVLVHVDDDGKAEQITPLDPAALQESETSLEPTEPALPKSTEGQTEADEESSETEEVVFESESFSVYALVYTVDFHWEVDGKVFEFTLPGGGYLNLKTLIEVLGIAEKDGQKVAEDGTEYLPNFMEEIQNVEFTDPELVWVGQAQEAITVGALKEANALDCLYSAELTEEQIEQINTQTVDAGDWALISLQPFASEESLTVTMVTGETFTIMVTDTASTNPQNTKISRDNMNVDNRDEGIIIKLFDYSGTVNNQNIDAVWGNGTSSDALRRGTGVNNGRTLVFSGSGLENQEWYNNFTGTRPSGMDFYSGYRSPGIVKNELVNGYPELSENITRYGSDDGNLDYLFKSGEQSGVTEYSANGQGLQGLLRKDSNGYYYYSSEDNYARYDGSDYIDLYTDTYYKENGAAAAHNNGFGSIGFFPFTNYSPSHTKEKGPDTPNELYYDHQLGMSMQAYFTYPPHGKLDDGQGDPMTFEFSGDDDVWVYVDGKLALDLGGVHQPIKGVIDFANKEVRYYEYDAYNSTYAPKQERITTIPFSEIFGEDGFDDSSYSTHKLDFFFLERGGCDSNCALSFNLQTLATAEKQFTKVDDQGAGLPGAEFTVYTNEECTEPLSVNNAPLTARSDENGKVTFSDIPVRRDSEGTPLIYYMKETKAPGGFIPNNTTYKLVYNTNTKTYDVLTLDDQSSEQIVNTPVHPIELGVEKQWQDAAGNDITPEAGYSATFEVTRTKSWIETTSGTDPSIKMSTLRIGYYYDKWENNRWNTYYGLYDNQTYSFAAGTQAEVSYNYKNDYNNENYNWRRYRINQNGSVTENIADTGTIPVTMPGEGQTTTVYLYDNWVQYGNSTALDSMSATGTSNQSESEIPHVDDPDDFSRTLTLSGSTTSGTFDSGMYAGTADAGKFPVEEVIDGITYTYKYYITEIGRTPSNNDSIFVDADGKVIADPASHYVTDDTTQTVINRERLNIPFEKYWDYDANETQDAYSWTATLQLESRLVDKTTGEAVTSFEAVEGKQLTVSSQNNGQGSFDDLPMFGVKDGTEYRYEYSVSEIAYEVKRTSNNEIVARWQDPNYYDPAAEQVGDRYSLHFIQDAGENGSTIDDYSIIVNNTPENRVETKNINISIQKTWPGNVDLNTAYADFVLKRYVYEEYRNFPADTTEWVEITLDTGNGSPQTLRVPKDWQMTIFCNVKANTNAESIEFSGIDSVSYDNSNENSEHLLTLQFTADQTKTVTLQNGAQYVAGGTNGFRLTDINDTGDMIVKQDKGFELPFTLNDNNDWQAAFHHLPAIEEDTQYNVEFPLEITRYVYRYYIEETGCRPEDYVATFKDSGGNLFGDSGNRIDNDAEITAENDLKEGALKITKNVTVDGAQVSNVNAALVDGDYTFTVSGVEGTETEGITRDVVITISGGQSNTVEVGDLKPGQYIITEQDPVNGTTLVGENGITVTVDPGKTGNEVPDTAIGEFTNNINVTSIEFKKDWKQSDKTTPYTGNEDVTVTYTLMQVARNNADEVVRNDVYEGTYILNNNARTATADAPCIFYVTQNTPVAIEGLPTSGKIGETPVTYTYYAVEAELEGFSGNTPAPVAEGDYTITNSEIPETSRTTDISVEKEWVGDNADQIGGVKFKLIQEKAELPQSVTEAFYPFTIVLQDGDGTVRQEHVIKYVKHGTYLSIPVIQIGEGDKGSVRRGTESRSDGEAFQVPSINGVRSITLRLEDEYEWGTDWKLGEIAIYNDKGQVSDDPKTFVDQLNSVEETKLSYTATEVEYTINMPSAGSSEVVGNTYTTTDYPDEWKTKVNDLPYYERGEDGKYYVYRYRVAEVSIIDPETKEEIEAVTQYADGTGGESLHFTIAYDNNSDPLKITNTRRAETSITLKKVDQENVNKENLLGSDLLQGATFKIEKYLDLSAGIKDTAWNAADEHSEINEGNSGVFTFTGLLPGIYMIEEIDSPAGYVKITSNPVIQVNDDLTLTLLDPDGTPVPGNANDMVRIVDDTTEIIVGNTPGAALPSTGGRGITMFYVLGGCLICLAAALLFRRRCRA